MKKKSIANAILISLASYIALFLFCSFLYLARFRGGLLEYYVNIAPLNFAAMGGLAIAILLNDWLGEPIPKPSRYFSAFKGFLIFLAGFSACTLTMRYNTANLIRFADIFVTMILWVLAVRKMQKREEQKVLSPPIA